MRKLLLIMFLLIPSALFAQNITDSRINFKNNLESLGMKYYINYLPINGYTYNNTTYKVKPTSIWWHWDAGSNVKNSKDAYTRVQTTFNILTSRIANNDRVSSHFSVGPNTILQMMPFYDDGIIQARLTNDRNIEDVKKAESYGAIQIETTGKYYDTNPPLPSQTNTLIILTRELMKKYNIAFSQIFGHFEKSPYIDKIDPGPKYMNETRIKLLKYLIDKRDWDLIGDPSTWNFYTEKLDQNNKVIEVLGQNSDEIMQAIIMSYYKNL